MVALTVKGFLGENRALRPTFLPPPVGVVSVNQKPGRGDLRPWRSPLNVATVPTGRRTIYRMGRDVISDSQYWLSWTTPVHVVTGLVADDETERTYYTGDGPPKVTDNQMGIGTPPYPSSNRPLGLPKPVGAPTVTPLTTGSSTQQEAYFYVYTYVNDWGWESAPSPVSAVSIRKIDGTSTISGFSSVPDGNYAVTAIRVYRTQSSSSGTVFQQLAEVSVGTTSVVDNNQTLGSALETTFWLPAPSDLRRLTPLWNGMLAGISDGAVRFCEADVPYAWPPTYEVLPSDGKPVSLGVYGQNLVVLTNTRPLLVAGSTPDAMDAAPIPMAQACIAAESAVSMGSGVAWASEDGLCWYGDGGGRILTAGCMTREDWQALVPSTIVGAQYEGLYFGSYDDGSGRKGFIVDPQNPESIFFLTTGYLGMHFDELRDQLYVLNGVNVQKWDAGASFLTYRFRSRVFTLPAPMNLGCAAVVASSYPVTLRVFADGVLRHTETVASRRGFRLPSGFLADEWQVEVEGSTPVESVTLASSMTELAQT